ncbi:MAG: M15 family metallopeptidase, partial [Gammaproteobacteria bacterium]
RQGHNEIPRHYGPQILTRRDADLDHPAPPAATHAAGAKTKDEILATLSGCGLVPSTVKTVADYEAQVLTKGTVFGKSVRLHPQFLAKLQAAEKALGTTPHGVASISDYRAGSSSYHGWGLAIDFNPGENPYVMHESGEKTVDDKVGPIYHRISWLMLGRASHVPSGLSKLARDAVAASLVLQQESMMFPVYFALADSTDAELQKYIDARGGSVAWKDVWGNTSAPTPSELKALIASDRDALRGPQPPPSKGVDAPFKHIDPKKKGFLNLPLALVKALKDQGLRWGAIDLGGASGDVMHFDEGFSPLGKFIYAAKYAAAGKDPSCPAGAKAKAVALAATGTPADMTKYLAAAAKEKDAGLAAALAILKRYNPPVDVAKIRFVATPEVKSRLGGQFTEVGRSWWDGTTPVVELEQEAYNTIADHLAGKAKTTAVHRVIRTLGHEMFHLWRGKKASVDSNPIQPVYDKEAVKRLEEVRKNWLDQAKDNPHIRREMKIPASVTDPKWSDVPADVAKKIERDATDTDYIDGLYKKSAYLVEEIYAKVEELSFLRAQQKLGSPDDVAASRTGVRELSDLVYKIRNHLKSFSGPDAFIKPDLLDKTMKAMLATLRSRYPHPSKKPLDSYEVIFYLSAIRGGQPPHYNDKGELVSAKPDGARLPAAVTHEFGAPKVSQADLRKRIDEYFERANAKYKMPDGSTAQARSQFQYGRDPDISKHQSRLTKILGSKFKVAIHYCIYGRPILDQIQELTQALIDSTEGAAYLKKKSAAEPSLTATQLIRALQY